MTCYRCKKPSAYRHIAVHVSWWRRMLHRGPKIWATCAEHHYDPISDGHRTRIRAVTP